MLNNVTSTPIRVAGRTSPLSLRQIDEVLTELQTWRCDIEFEVHPVETYGDRDQSTSLRLLENTDFFTREVDALVLQGLCQVAIHSAKDMPSILPEGLAIAAITKGVDPADSLVMRSGMSFDTLPPGARIATSSIRREAALRELRPDFTFCDLRGTIHKRLALLDTAKIEGVIIAEAALIRLQMTHLNRFRLSIPTAKGQGQLAVVARCEDEAMLNLFRFIDSRSITKDG